MRASKEYTGPIKVSSFGGLALENECGRISESFARPSLSWQLLKYLYVHRQLSVDVEEIKAVLWPEEEELCDAILRVRLKRLRDSLEPLCVANNRRGLVLYSMGKFSLNSDFELQTDEEEYRALMDALRESPADSAEGLGFCLAALELQRGEYMGRGAESWLEPYREYYRREFAFLARNALERMERVQDWRGMSLLCSRAEEVAPEDGELHRAIIRELVGNRLEPELVRHVARLSRRGVKWLEGYEYEKQPD